MRRLLPIALLALAPALGAQAAPASSGVVIGAHLRVETPLREADVVGTLVARYGDTLVVQTRDVPSADARIEQVTLAGDQITHAFVTTHHESRFASGTRGAVYGALFAVGLTAISRTFATFASDGESADGDPQADWTDRPSFLNTLARVATVTVPFGATAGAFRPRPTWTEVPLGSR